MRISSGIVASTLLSGCSAAGEVPQADVGGELAYPAGQERIACASAPSVQFSFACKVERQRENGTQFLTVRHPDGRFRRFEVLGGGGGIALADGAGRARTALSDDILEVAIDGDRYRFPAELRYVQGK